MDPTAAINRIRSEAISPGQHLVRAAIEVCSRLMSRDNEVTVLWVAAHVRIAGNEADRLANEVAKGRTHEVPDEYRWGASLSHLSRVVTENRSCDTVQWAASHTGQRADTAPLGNSSPKEAAEASPKTLAGRYYQLLPGHAAIGSFLHERMAGTQRPEPSERWWCNRGRRQSHYHLFVGYRAWAPRIGRLCRGSARIVDGSTRGHRRPGGRGARGLPGQCWSSWRIPEKDAGRSLGQCQGLRGRKAGRGRARDRRGNREARAHPRLHFVLSSLCLFLCQASMGTTLSSPTRKKRCHE